MDNRKLKKSLQYYSNNSLDLHNFDFRYKKLHLIGFFLGTIFLVIGSLMFSEKFKRFNYGVFFHEKVYEKMYEKNVSLFKSHGEIYDKTYEEYYNYMFNRHTKKDINILAFIYFFVTLPLLLFLFKRSPYPVRFDRASQLIYTIYKGNYYSVDYKELNMSFEKTHALLDYTTHYGPLAISLNCLKTDKKIKFRLGNYPAFENQNIMLHDWLDGFMNGDLEADMFNHHKRNWLDWSLLPARKLTQYKIDKAIEKA